MNCVSVVFPFFCFKSWFGHLRSDFASRPLAGFIHFAGLTLHPFSLRLLASGLFKRLAVLRVNLSLLIFSFLCFTSFFEVLRAHFAACPPTGFIHVAGLTLHFFVTSLLGSLVFRAIVCFSMSIFCCSLLLSLCSISLLEPLCSHFVAVSTKGFTHETVRTLHFFSRRALPP